MADPRSAAAARLLAWLPLAMVAVAVLLSILALPHLPERVPTRWDSAGQPTQHLPRGLAAFLMVGLMLQMWLMIGGIGWAMSQSREARDVPPHIAPLVTATIVGLLLVVHLGLLGTSLGWNVPLGLVIHTAVGGVLAIVGLAMRRVPPNPLIGVRTAATMSSPAVWRRANDVGGRAMVVAGGIVAIGGLLEPLWAGVVLGAAVLGAVVVSMAAARRAAAEEDARA